MEVVSMDGDNMGGVSHKKRSKLQTILIGTKILLIDVCYLIFYSFPIIIFYGWRQKIGFTTGFFCNDNSIRYPYLESKISHGNIAAQSLLGPPLVLILIEALFNRRHKKSLWKLIYARIVRYYHGFFICMSFIYVPKLFRGNLRPHFMDVCDPNVDCTEERNNFRFIEEYKCNKDHSIDIYMSFPSVHTSAAVFIAIYLIFYFGKRIKWMKMRLCLQFLMLLYAYTIALSRIAEHYHHASDVIVGAIIGGLTAFAAVKYFEGFFRSKSGEKD